MKTKLEIWNEQKEGENGYNMITNKTLFPLLCDGNKFVLISLSTCALEAYSLHEAHSYITCAISLYSFFDGSNTEKKERSLELILMQSIVSNNMDAQDIVA